jgi:hypothetical protein
MKVFISYSWKSDSHRMWVFELADLLTKQGLDVIIYRDLLGGRETTKFMEKEIEAADIFLIICSDLYTQRANERERGAGYETIIATKKYYHTDAKGRFIPVVRDNNLPPYHKIPAYLGAALYIDMDREDWKGEPFQKLMQAINSNSL